MSSTSERRRVGQTGACRQSVSPRRFDSSRGWLRPAGPKGSDVGNVAKPQRGPSMAFASRTDSPSPCRADAPDTQEKEPKR